MSTQIGYDREWAALEADLKATGDLLTVDGFRIRRDRTLVLGDVDVEKIARRVVELLREGGAVA